MTALFTVYPAIDLKDGDCVRLLRGDMDQATVFSHSPAAQAKVFEDAGFTWLHVVDLNGAFAGAPVNSDAVAAILSATTMNVQLGGGVRDLARIEDWLARGVARVILGTVAVREPEMVKAACRHFPGHVAVGIDARDGLVATEGWAAQSEMSVHDVALRFEDAGVAAIIYTDIGRDGAMVGVNVEATAALAAVLSTPVIASGGVRALDDIRALKARAHQGLAGVVVGRALYDGGIAPAAAVAA